MLQQLIIDVRNSIVALLPWLHYRIDLSSQFPFAVGIVAQVFEHIKRSTLHKFSDNQNAFLRIQVMQCLVYLHLTGQQVILSHERACVMLVIVEKMNADVLLAQEVVKGAVGVEAPETVKV